MRGRIKEEVKGVERKQKIFYRFCLFIFRERGKEA